MEAVKAVICVSRYRRKKEDSQVSENGTENHGEVKTEDADANGETPDEERDGDAEAQEDGEEEGEEADEELGALKESQAEEQPEVVTQEPGEEAGEEGEQEGAEEEEACESDPVAMEVADEGEEDAVQALPVGIANASGPIDGEDEECLDEEAMEDDGDVRDIQEIEAMFLADLEDDDDDHVAEVASISAPAWEGAKESLLGEVESDVGPVAAAVRDKVPPWNQPLPAEEAEAVSSDSDEATDEDEEEINLSQYEISDDDDENLEPPVDISDAESDLLDFDDLGDDDWQDDDDWKNYEDESEDDQEDLGPLKHGFTTWLACLAEELPLQLARPQAAKSLRERLLTELREQDGKERLDRHLSVQWEHSLVFEDCPPLLGFTSYQDALCLLRCPALKDLRLVLAWSEKPEEAPTATPSQPRWKTIPPREDRMPKHIPPRERSRSRDRQSLGYFSQPPYREDDRKTKADYRHVHTDQWWTKEFLSIPQENPKVAFDREGVLVVYKPAFWTVTTCAARDRVSTRYEALQDWIRHNMGYRYPWLYANDRAGLIHRLDVQTSGPIVVAGSPRAFRSLKESLHHHTFYKEYIALMHGALPIRECCGVLDYPLLTTEERGSVGWRTCVDPQGAEAMTRYEAIAAYKYSEGHGKTQRYTLVRLQLITGKTHQIRVHLMELARRLNLKTHGIVGDYKYLPPHNLKLDKRICRRVFLHCYRLHFPMPDVQDQDAKCRIRCPLPPELQQALKMVNFDKSLTAAYRKQNQKGSMMEIDDLMDQRKSTNIPGVTDYTAPWATKPRRF